MASQWLSSAENSLPELAELAELAVL